MKNYKKPLLTFISLVIVVLLVWTYFNASISIFRPEPIDRDGYILDKIDRAKSDSGLDSYARELATDGSAKSVRMLLRSINLANNDDKLVLAKGLDFLNNQESSTLLIDYLELNVSYESGNSIIFGYVRDALGRNASGDDVVRMYNKIEEINNIAIKSIDESGRSSNEKDYLLRSFFMGALLRVKSDNAVQSLVDLSIKNNKSTTYNTLTTTLGMIGSQSAVNGLVEIINSLSINNVKDSAVQALMNVTNVNSKKILDTLSKESDSQIIKDASLSALSKMIK